MSYAVTSSVVADSEDEAVRGWAPIWAVARATPRVRRHGVTTWIWSWTWSASWGLGGMKRAHGLNGESVGAERSLLCGGRGANVVTCVVARGARQARTVLLASGRLPLLVATAIAIASAARTRVSVAAARVAPSIIAIA